MESITVLEVILETIAFRDNITIILHDEMISQLFDWKQALQACIHIAVIGVIVETNDAIFKLRHSLILLYHCRWFLIVFLPLALSLSLLLFSKFNHLEF